MGYIGSYVWKMRQKVGKETIITATVDVFPVDKNGKMKLVYLKQYDQWSYAGGHAEIGDSWEDAALHELREETGITARKEDLELFATVSGAGYTHHYPNGDTQPFTLSFVCHDWLEEDESYDEEEISRAEWMTIEEARAKVNIDPRVLRLFDAYELYRKTGRVQMVQE